MSPSSPSEKPLIAILIAAVLAMSAIGLFGYHYGTAHTVNPADLSKIKIGMTWAHAKPILKTHKTPTALPDGTYIIGFRKHDRWCMVDLTLDSHLRVTSIFHDH